VASHKRHWSELDAQTLLAELEEARRAAIQAMAKAPINEPVYQSVMKLTHAIDDVVEACGRPRSYFWTKPHSA
jgi:hypothetical protein